MSADRIQTLVQAFLRNFKSVPSSPWDNAEPVREELFSADRLEQHARSLAAAQPTYRGASRGRSLTGRLADNEAALQHSFLTTMRVSKAGVAITPAAIWLIDNYHLVERQIREIRADLPPRFYRQLPKLAAGPFVGYPRVFGVAWAYVAHTDSDFNAEGFVRYLRAYQQVQPLTIGELWAVAITLRIVLVENLRRLAVRIEASQEARRDADQLADRLIELSENGAQEIATLLDERPPGPLPDAFAVQFDHRIRDQRPDIGPASTWLDAGMAARGTTTHAAVINEQERQVAATITVRNIITSMRMISEIDWMELFERMSPVDDVLGEASGYREMDFATRNLYRSAIEALARGSGRSEIEIAARAVSAAARPDAGSLDGDPDPRLADPGYYLLGNGRPSIEAAIGYRTPLAAWPRRLSMAFGITGYGSAIILVSVLVLLIPVAFLSALDQPSWWLALLAILGTIPALDAAVALVNAGVTRSVPATALPALELRGGVPATLRTMVVVPVLLIDAADIEEQVEALEIHHLASLEGDVHFALLSDWADAATETRAGDEALLAIATAAIARLNARYPAPPGGDRFLLLHRRRVWTPSEARWIGWERKRGKLHELNRLLRGATDTSFLISDETARGLPTDVRFVITLDADTRLPRDTVRRLIGKLAHPLNRPRFDAARQRVVEGYGILQPRITPSLPGNGQRTKYQRIFSSQSGIDPYAAAASDVYQDLFGEGSYAGKGIYDVDAFEAALAGRVPPSTLLSHDLFEGIFARAGLASDVEVVEDFPSRYDVAVRRHHRWARGDWQLLPWIFRSGRHARSAMPATGRLKMVDNLRRSLTGPSFALALAAGWVMPLPAAAAWTIFLLVLAGVPAMIPVLESLAHRPSGSTLRDYLEGVGDDAMLALARWGLVIVFVADQAWSMADAIIRTLVRLTITRRNLLQWTPAAQLSHGPDPGIGDYYRRMAGAVALAIVAIVTAWVAGAGAWPLAAVFAGLWIASPLVAHTISQSPPLARRVMLHPDDVAYLRLIARRTWRYFETFVTAGENMLPPDNFQEDPAPVIAHRTSPTNIGLYLLSIVSARSFGWIGLQDAVDRLEPTLVTMGRMERYRGHFYNWYDTTDLRVLDPRYVSSVDSGNLAGHLVALASACRTWRDIALPIGAEPFKGQIADTLIDGMRDAIGLAAAELRPGGGAATALARLSEALATVEAAGLVDGAALAQLAALAQDLADTAIEPGCDEDTRFWASAVLTTIESHRRDLDAAGDLAERLAAIEAAARELAVAMDFGFLLDRDRNLLSIGYATTEGMLDQSCYDLLASEARLASFFAIAKGDIPARHWFRLGHAITPVRGGPVLISWSGSMFEYLMPTLVMRAPEGSLIERTECRIVSRQIDYGSELATPWGISESAFNARDLELTYQYSNFGVPGLGLKRGLADSAVIAPYATALAAMMQPQAAIANFERLENLGAKGRFGYYEALDFTQERVPQGRDFAIVRNFMAHHQGMSIVSLANTVLGGVIAGHFHDEPIVKAAELLLQERMPRHIAVTYPGVAEEGKVAARIKDIEPTAGRRYTTPDGIVPETHLLSNGRYTVMLTSAGSGFSRWRDHAVTRWREDVTCDDWGSYIFLRDIGTAAVWSAGFQPIGSEPDDYEVLFTEDRAEYIRRDGDLTTAMTVLVSAEDDSEVRRITVTNTGKTGREIEITSYAELALALQAADVAHPVFSKLFIETEYHPDLHAIIAHRRPRDAGDGEIWAAHAIVGNSSTIGDPEFETDRMHFVGRGHTTKGPRAILERRSLTGATGAVLDPVFALRTRVRVAAGGSAHVAFWTMAGSSRQQVLDLVDKHRASNAFERAATQAWTQAQVQLHHLRLSPGKAGQIQRLARHMIYASPEMRPASETIAAGAGPQSELWSLGISGDLPIILLRISDTDHLGLARDLLQAADYWRMKRMAFDIVILNERGTSYIQDLQNGLEALVRAGQSRAQFGERVPGSAYVLRSDLIPEGTRALLLAVARVVLVGQNGPLANQLDTKRSEAMTRRAPPRKTAQGRRPVAPQHPSDLEFFNGIGGFANEGREYAICLGPDQVTPAPWINVIANPDFGFQVSADGAGFTWARNSREHQLTPWSNDPVQDPAGQAFYVRDDDTGLLFSPTSAPLNGKAGSYVARHGWGYSRFEHSTPGLDLALVEFVPLADPIKISRLTLRNTSDRSLRLTVSAYVAWVLGQSRAAAAPHTATEIDAETGAMFARNRWTPAFAEQVAFFDLGGRQQSWTGDRREFIGRNGQLDNPAALARRAPLSKRVGAGLDPCGAMQTQVILAPGTSIDIACFLGEAANAAEASILVKRYRAANLDTVFEAVGTHWEDLLGSVQVKTPDRAFDVMLNGWLLYQTLACRIWARAAFYQASGAYGFRDQLQDVMALVQARPDIARTHLLRAAGRQFVEGDVQHWWLPHSGQGVRTRFSDDRVWLAYVAANYIATSGDTAVLDVEATYLEGPTLGEGEAENFFQPATSAKSASLYEHCATAIDASLHVGSHGMPLIGGGDWNDGFNRVGREGRGESVWLGWFLDATITAFLPVAQSRGDTARVAAWSTHTKDLRVDLDAKAWDGEWYRRGWFDDGTPLGASASVECRIDSIAQSWAAISGAGDHDRAVHAMEAVERALILPESGLALLFAPPFDRTPLDPGYVKAYPPGIRENGGQYTHAALWSVMAFAALGEGGKAAGLFAMLNPINHSLTNVEAHRYKVEPYVVAADIYSRPPHVGRGGWTWYTGAAGWMQRAGIESILGLRIEGEALLLDPCIPEHWPHFEIKLRRGAQTYEIHVENPASVCRGIVDATFDGEAVTQRPLRIEMKPDGQHHVLKVRLG